MKKTAIVTDTTACIPQEYAEELGIGVVPVQLVIDGRTYRDGIDISPSDFYAILRKNRKIPTTSSASPEPYLNAFYRASEKFDSIICVTEPSRFSAMYSSALVAREIARETLKDVSIEILECTTAAAGQGLAVLAAARAAATDKSTEEVRRILTDTMSRVKLFAMLDTLRYLVRSGRVPQAALLVNSILNIKPVFSLNHSGAHRVALPRTVEKAMDNMLKLMDESIAPGQKLRVAVMHADALESANLFRSRIAARFDCREILLTAFTPVMGAHTGPGLIGVTFYPD